MTAGIVSGVVSPPVGFARALFYFVSMLASAAVLSTCQVITWPVVRLFDPTLFTFQRCVWAACFWEAGVTGREGWRGLCETGRVRWCGVAGEREQSRRRGGAKARRRLRDWSGRRGVTGARDPPSVSETPCLVALRVPATAHSLPPDSGGRCFLRAAACGRSRQCASRCVQQSLRRGLWREPR